MNNKFESRPRAEVQAKSKQLRATPVLSEAILAGHGNRWPKAMDARSLSSEGRRAATARFKAFVRISDNRRNTLRLPGNVPQIATLN